MRPFTIFLILLMFLSIKFVEAQTSWKGTTSTEWRTSSNWTNGVPTSTTDVIIGDANFTGGNQPAMTRKQFCKSLTIGTGSKISELTVPKNLTVIGDITIGSFGKIIHKGAITIKLNGNWSNTGSYTTNNNACAVVFSGVAQSITGATTFRALTINVGSTLTLLNNITVNNMLTVNGTLDPTETSTVYGTGAFRINAGGVIIVKAINYATNYSISGTITLSGTSTVNYASSTINQVVANNLTYGYLRISGGLIKTLAGNLPSLNSSSTTSGRIYIDAGTLDLLTYTANRGISTSGGSVIVAAGATLKIGGTNTFPANYLNNNLAATSTIIYGGTAQTVRALSYGNLTLSSSSGSVVKTMPATALVVAGNLTADVGAGTAVSFTAGNAITVNRDVILGAGCTFNGGSYSHLFKGNWINTGTYTGSTSTSTFSGVNAAMSGSGTNNFYNLVFSGTGITASGSTNISVAGNLSTTGSGMFTHSTSGTLTMSGASKTITGIGLNFYHLIISGTISTTANIIISGNFTANNTFAASSGVITFNGISKTISGAGAIAFYSMNILGIITASSSFSMLSNLSVSLDGSFTASSGTVTFNGSTSLSGTANLYDVTINSAKTLILGGNSILGIGNVFTKTGTLNVTTTIPNTVQYNSPNNQNIVSATYDNLILANANTKTALGAITVNEDLTINTGVTFNASTFTHSVYRHFINNGTFTASSSTIQLLGLDAANIIGTTTFNNLVENKDNATIAITLLNNVTVQNLTMTSGKMNTGANSITITGTRTGDGIIIGTITHNHAFVNATAYYFEGPQNAITFDSPDAALNSVSVTVTINEITDFIPGSDCVTREYSISIPSGTYTNAAIKLHYEDNELNAFVEPFLTQYHFVSGTSWDSVGVTTRNSTLNFVEKTAIANIAGRWVLSGLKSTVRWNGSVSSAWENPANWTTIAGTDMSNRVPTSVDAAQIGYVAFTYNPIISSNQTISVLNFGTVQASTLTIAGSNSLTTLGAVKGDWSSSKSHLIDVASGTLNVGTNLILSDGISGHDIELRIGTGSVSVGNNLIQTANASINFTGNGSLSIDGNYNYTSGNFTSNTGTVIYSGGNPQVVAPLSYYNLSIAKTTERAIINYPDTISGNLLLTTGGGLVITDAVTINGNLSIGVGTSLIHQTTNPLNVKGNWSNNGIFEINNSVVCFNGTGNQSVATDMFNTLIVDKPSGILTLTSDLSIQSNLTITAGTLDLSTYLANRVNPGGILTLGSSAVLKIAGSDNFPNNFNTKSIDALSTVEYLGTIAQSVKDISYGNLTISNGGSTAKTLNGNIQINGNLLINSNSTLNPDVNDITLYGNFTNAGTYIPSSSTLLLSGTNKTITGTTVLNNFYVLGSYTTSSCDSISAKGDFVIATTGSMNFLTTTFLLDGDLTNNGSLLSNGIAVFTGTREQVVQLNTSVTSTSTGQLVFDGTVSPILNSTTSPAFATVKIYNTGGVTASVPWTVAIACIVGPGATFNGSSLNHTFLGHFYNYGTVTSSGTLNFSPIYFPSTIMLDNGTSFTSTGKVVFGGNKAITITGNSSTFNDVSITNTNVAGVTPQKSWTINNDLFIGPNATFNAGTALSHTIVNNLTDNGTLNGETSTITFIGNPSDIDGIGTTTFNNLIIGDTAVFNLNKSINISKDFICKTLDFATSGYGITFSGNTPSTINSTVGAITFDYLEQDKQGSNETTLSIPVSINNDLVLTNGIIKTTATNILIINDDANASSGTTTSFVDGPMKKIGNDPFVFPVGNNSVWARIGISAPTSALAEFQASYSHTYYIDTINVISPLNNVSTGEYWILDRTSGTDNVEVSLYWENGARSGIVDLADLVVAKYNGAAWEDKTQNGGVTGTVSTGTVTSQTITSFSPFAFGSKAGINPLPVEFLSLTAKYMNDAVYLQWTTATETNNDYFTVERSQNGTDFEEVKKVKGAGTSVVQLDYYEIDHFPFPDISYYRIKQTDYNGAFKYSSKVAVKANNVAHENDITVYPNPTKADNINIEFKNIDYDKIKITLLNSTGSAIFAKTYDLSGYLDTKITIEPSVSLQAGIYFIYMKNNSFTLKKKVVIY